MAKAHDLEPSIPRIEELARKVKEGDIKLPKFQRPFVWKQKGILDLLDSIYKGYPIGSVLLWRTKERLSSERTIGDLEVDDRPEEYPTNYLLDGQQRISTICGVLFWNGLDNKSKWNVVFDLREQVFLYSPDHIGPHFFPLNKLMDTRDYNRQCRALESLPDAERLQTVADRLLNAFKDYKLAAVTLGDMSIKQVAPIFERINSTGRRLTVVDLMRAATWKDGFDLTDAILRISRYLKPKGFGSVPEKNVLRNLAASAGKGILRSDIDSLREYSGDQLKTLTETTERSYKLAVDFLHTELRVSSYEFLPYALQLTLLVEFFRLNRAPSMAQRRALRTWFWRTSIAEHYQGANTTKEMQDLHAMRALASGASSHIPFDGRVQIRKFMSSTFRLNVASSKTFALLLANRKPLNLVDGAPIDTMKALATANYLEFHHLFPKEFLKSQGFSVEMRNRLGNICMLHLSANRTIADKRPNKYLMSIAGEVQADLTDVLKTNFISDHAWDAALREDYEEFLQLRTESLCDAAATLADVDE